MNTSAIQQMTNFDASILRPELGCDSRVACPCPKLHAIARVNNQENRSGMRFSRHKTIIMVFSAGIDRIGLMMSAGFRVICF
jgi:hypothetical protein